MSKKHTTFVVTVLGFFILSSCNVFSPFDDPTSNDQLVSKARACFDEGDLKCARENYTKIQGTSYDDLRASERAFALLDEEGAGFEDFIKAFKDSNAGSALTQIAGAISYGSGENKRKRIYEAYTETLNITSNPQLRGLVRFVTSLVFAAEILAEDVGDNSVLEKSDLTNNTSICKDGGIIGCATTTACAAPQNSKIVTGNELLAGESNPFVTKTNLVDLSGSPTLHMLHSAVQAANYAIAVELGANGRISNDKIGKFTSTVSISRGAACFRYLLVDNGIGVDR